MNGPGALDPPLDFPAYHSTEYRAPRLAFVPLPEAQRRGARAATGSRLLTAAEMEASDAELETPGADLTVHGDGDPIGERIVVSGRVLDSGTRPVPGALVEVWQANAAGRYRHERDQHDAPLDPGFVGAGRCRTGPDGRFRFVTIKPGAYPWTNHHNAWRPAHIHFSVTGRGLLERLITQMYFPGDPLLGHDPIFQSVPAVGRPRLVSAFDLDLTVPGTALGYRWDIVLRGPDLTPPDPAVSGG